MVGESVADRAETTEVTAYPLTRSAEEDDYDWA
jgi:hypothetical protein